MGIIGINQELLQALQLRVEVIETERHAAVVFVGHYQAVTFRNINLANLKPRLHKATRAQPQQLERSSRFRRFDDFSGFERLAHATQNQRQSQVFRQQLLFFHQNAARVHQKRGVRCKRVGNLFFACNPANRFAFDNPDIDFGWKFADNFDFIDLRQLLQSLVDPRQVYPKNIFPFAQTSDIQDLVALQSSISLHFDVVELVVRVVDEEPLGRDPGADIKSPGQQNHQRDLREHDEQPAVTVLDRLARAHFDVE